MGLLGKAIATNAPAGNGASDGGDASGEVASGDVQSFIINYHRKNPRFHAIVFQGGEASSSAASRSGNISGMIACHGGAAAALPGGNLLVLLPGTLDRELFAHRLSRSAGLTVLSQLSADSPSLAIESLYPYLQ